MSGDSRSHLDMCTGSWHLPRRRLVTRLASRGGRPRPTSNYSWSMLKYIQVCQYEWTWYRKVQWKKASESESCGKNKGMNRWIKYRLKIKTAESLWLLGSDQHRIGDKAIPSLHSADLRKTSKLMCHGTLLPVMGNASSCIPSTAYYRHRKTQTSAMRVPSLCHVPWSHTVIFLVSSSTVHEDLHILPAGCEDMDGITRWM